MQRVKQARQTHKIMSMSEGVGAGKYSAMNLKARELMSLQGNTEKMVLNV